MTNRMAINMDEKICSNITVVSNEEIALKDGTRAYRTDIEWTMNNNQPVKTNLVSTYKDSQCVYIAVHEFRDSQTIQPILESWMFE